MATSTHRTLYAAGGTFVITVTAADDDGGSDTESTSATVAALDTAPTITATATSGGLPYLAGNWTNQDVVVHFECGDDSGTVDCPIDVTVTTEGTTPFVDGTATDGTGHGAHHDVRAHPRIDQDGSLHHRLRHDARRPAIRRRDLDRARP